MRYSSRQAKFWKGLLAWVPDQESLDRYLNILLSAHHPWKTMRAVTTLFLLSSVRIFQQLIQVLLTSISTTSSSSSSTHFLPSNLLRQSQLIVVHVVLLRRWLRKKSYYVVHYYYYLKWWWWTWNIWHHRHRNSIECRIWMASISRDVAGLMCMIWCCCLPFLIFDFWSEEASVMDGALFETDMPFLWCGWMMSCRKAQLDLSDQLRGCSIASS